MPTTSELTGLTTTVAELRDRAELATVEDRRSANRVAAAPALCVSPIGGAAGYQCQADNVSEGGLYVKLPMDCCLAVGQRCEVTFSRGQGKTDMASLTGLTCYATVVRTDQLIADPKPLVGAGLRFDRPLFL